jgi:hypothetical protein
MLSEIRKGTLRWLGHVERMQEEKTVKKVFKNIPEGKKFRWKAKRAMAGQCSKLSEENVC